MAISPGNGISVRPCSKLRHRVKVQMGCSRAMPPHVAIVVLLLTPWRAASNLVPTLAFAIHHLAFASLPGMQGVFCLTRVHERKIAPLPSASVRLI